MLNPANSGPNENILSRFEKTRGLSIELANHLSAEDQALQSMPDASPVKWHLAHTTWFFETFILKPYSAQYTTINPHYEVMFNSYYQAVGPQFKRANRSILSRPSATEVIDYRTAVDQKLTEFIDIELPDLNAGVQQEIYNLLVLGINHEQQHQELLLTDIKHALSFNPMLPAFKKDTVTQLTPQQISSLSWTKFSSGVYDIGHADQTHFCFDNELPQHKQYLAEFQIANRLITNKEYTDFILDGGYQNPQHWLSEGWAWVEENALSHPLYWRKTDQGWSEFSLNGLISLNPASPVHHVSYYEADAYSKWVGKRLPTESEGEVASHGLETKGNLLNPNKLKPEPVDTSNDQLQQMFGDTWEWTSSPYTAYPGFTIAEGAVGEYNGKFMVNQMVLRGGSCATPQGHIRPSYRNFFPAHTQWQFSGIRLASDI